MAAKLLVPAINLVSSSSPEWYHKVMSSTYSLPTFGLNFLISD